MSLPIIMAAHSHGWCMGLLQNYLGLEPAYKDGYDLPQPRERRDGQRCIDHTQLGHVVPEDRMT